MIRLVRVMRILRIFKLVRHFAGLQSLFYTLQQAYQELGLLLVIIAIVNLQDDSCLSFGLPLSSSKKYVPMSLL